MRVVTMVNKELLTIVSCITVIFGVGTKMLVHDDQESSGLHHHIH